MYEIQRPKKIFNAAMIALTVIITAFIPFFSEISKNISTISLCFGQVALVFLFVLVAFPRANQKHIIELSFAYILFIGSCFILLSFLPLDPSNKLFGWQNIPSLILVDIPALVFINIAAFIYLNLGFYVYKPIITDDTEVHPSNVNEEEYQEKLSSNPQTFFEKSLSSNLKQELKNFSTVQEVKKELRQEVENLFSNYIQETPEVLNDEQAEKLNRVEEILVQNLDSSVEEAICMDADGNILNNTVFRWLGNNREEIVELFEKHNLSAEQLKTGKLCQVLVKSHEKWYIISKYNHYFLVLKTSKEDPVPLLDTVFNVFEDLEMSA